MEVEGGWMLLDLNSMVQKIHVLKLHKIHGCWVDTCFLSSLVSSLLSRSFFCGKRPCTHLFNTTGSSPIVIISKKTKKHKKKKVIEP